MYKMYIVQQNTNSTTYGFRHWLLRMQAEARKVARGGGFRRRVAFGSAASGAMSYPFFMVKDDLDAAYRELLATGKAKAPAGTNPNDVEGIPIGLVRVATLDGLVDQMRGGDVDLSQSVVVGSREALERVRQLVQQPAA